jgi:hypothetical protein
MENKATPIERAFELAISGQFSSVSDIKAHLAKEKFDTDQLTGRTLMTQLKELMKELMKAAMAR